MNSPLTPDQLATIRSIVATGNKITAIKEYRALTGVDLAEAKAAVEKLMDDMPASAAPATLPRKSGCIGMLVAGIGIVGTAWALWAR